MVSNDIVFLELGFGLVFFFASAYLFRPSLAKCKSHFAIVSIVASKKSMSLKYEQICVSAVVFAILSAFGVAQSFGVKVSATKLHAN